jgi:hypothetical protein
MLRGSTVILFAGAIAFGLTSHVWANPSERSRGEENFTTLSGESLRGLENRSASENSPALLREDNSDAETGAISLPENESDSEAPEITLFGNTIKLSSEDSPQNADNVPSTHLELSDLEFSTGGSSVDGEQLMRVQYRFPSAPSDTE